MLPLGLPMYNDVHTHAYTINYKNIEYNIHWQCDLAKPRGTQRHTMVAGHGVGNGTKPLRWDG